MMHFMRSCPAVVVAVAVAGALLWLFMKRQPMQRLLNTLKEGWLVLLARSLVPPLIDAYELKLICKVVEKTKAIYRTYLSTREWLRPLQRLSSLASCVRRLHSMWSAIVLYLQGYYRNAIIQKWKCHARKAFARCAL